MPDPIHETSEQASTPPCPRCEKPMRQLACPECHTCDDCSGERWAGIGSCFEVDPTRPERVYYECAPEGVRKDADDA